MPSGDPRGGMFHVECVAGADALVNQGDRVLSIETHQAGLPRLVGGGRLRDCQGLAGD